MYGFLAVLVTVIYSFLVPVRILAQPYTSPSYKVEEYFFGSGGELESTSGTLKSRTSAGALAVGSATSTSFALAAGNVTAYEEYLEFAVNGGVASLGTITTTSTGTGTGTFTVRSYLSSGYVVKTISNPPTNESGEILDAMSAAAASAAGTEQFGINLVANTSPATFGAVPAQQPDGTFAYGQAATGYSTANMYKYTVGDTIATSLRGIGQTNYTISYIVNINRTTSAGLYSMQHDLVATSTF